MARKALGILLSLLLVCSFVLSAPALAASISTTVKTTRSGDTLYVRKGPHKGNTPTVGTVKNKQKITLIEINDEDDPEAWSKIKVNSTGAVGYLKNKYIRYFGLDNSDGEIDKKEDDDTDYRNASDNDGKKGSSSGSSSSGSSSTSATLGRVSTKNGGKVNVRKSGSTSASIVSSAYDGDKLTIVSKKSSWYKVKIDGVTGYIHANYVTEGLRAWTTAQSGVNLRKGAGTKYGVIKTLDYDTDIVVLSRSSNWSRVRTGGSTGYISNSYYQYY